MGTIVKHIGGIVCSYCGFGEADLYSCDDCGRIFCEDCGPTRNDDAPVDLCTDCVSSRKVLSKFVAAREQIKQLEARIKQLEAIVSNQTRQLNRMSARIDAGGKNL